MVSQISHPLSRNGASMVFNKVLELLEIVYLKDSIPHQVVVEKLSHVAPNNCNIVSPAHIYGLCKFHQVVDRFVDFHDTWQGEQGLNVFFRTQCRSVCKARAL